MSNSNNLIHALSGLNGLLLKLETFLMAACTLALVGAIFVEVLCRYLLFISTAWSEELSRYLFIWLTYIGSAYALSEGGHIEIDVCQQAIIKSKLRNKDVALKLLEVVSVISTAAFLVIFGVIFWNYMMKIFASIQTSPTMHIPMGLVYLPVFISTILGIIHCLYHLFGVLRPAEPQKL